MGSRQGPDWRRHFFYRKEIWKTTWKLRLSILALGVLVFWMTGAFWADKTGRSLVCTEQIQPSDALLIENFDPDYLVFERAAALQKAGMARRVLVPLPSPDDTETPNAIDTGIAELMSRVSHLENIETIHIRQEEPISLNAANQIRDFLVRERLRSLLVVTPGFRSRRSEFVYSSVLSPMGITVRCAPVFGLVGVENWTHTWHGMQEVALQFMKLQFYRFHVLR